MKNLKITAKLIVGFGSVLVMVIALGVISYLGLKNLESTTQGFTDVSIPAINDVWLIRRSMVSMQRYVLSEIITLDKNDYKKFAESAAKDNEAAVKALDDLEKLIPDIKISAEKVRGYIVENEATRLEIDKFSAALTEEGSRKAYELFNSKYVPVFDKAVTEILAISDDIAKRVSNSEIEAEKTANQNIVFVLILLGLVIAVVVVATVVITKSLSTPIKEIEAAAKDMAAGNLGTVITYQSKDELGMLSESMREAMQMMKGYVEDITYAMGEFADNSFVLRPPNKPFIGDFAPIVTSILQVVSNMTETLTQIKEAASQVSSGSDQVSSGAQALAQGATEQASAVQQLSASINEISHQVKQNADNSTNASSMATDAASAIDMSNKQMQELMVAMTDINSKSSEISKIIKTIEDIAFQTNILALNAAVEAARAGSAGKGFAVVADEVRNLAAKSADAAKNTTALIENSVNSISAGVRLADSTAKDLLGAVDSVKNTTDIISNITTASTDQAMSIGQVTIGVDQISSVVQTNSATSEESAAASEELSSQANLLMELISKFKLPQSEGAPSHLNTPSKTAKHARISSHSDNSKY